ncbi:hypothetical protein B7P43_G16085, partial [Cryptotermes secundus]
AYKYLGIEENHQIEHKKEKERLKKEYVRRLRLILNTELNAKHKMQAIGSLAVPVLRYSFGIINWHKEEYKNLAKNEYIVRHDTVCMHLHYSICKEFGIEVPDNWYSHVPKSVCEHEDITVYGTKAYKQTERFWQTGQT